MAVSRQIWSANRFSREKRLSLNAGVAGRKLAPRRMASRVLPLRAHNGETQWTMVELQGSLDGKAASLDGVHLGDLTERRVRVCCGSRPCPRAPMEWLTPCTGVSTGRGVAAHR